MEAISTPTCATRTPNERQPRKRNLGIRRVSACSVILMAGLAAGLIANAASAQTSSVSQPSQFKWEGLATMQFDVHLFDSGRFRDGEPEFISRYTPLRGFDGDDFPGYFVDLARLKLDLVGQETGRHVFGVDRTSLAYFNQKNAIYFNPEPLRLDIFHSLYRSQQFRSLNQPDPAVAGQNSIFAVFNDDSFGRTDYFVRRNDVGVNLRLRPSAFGHDGSHLGNIELSYDRSDWESVRFFDYVTTARLSTGVTPNQVRWRGIDQRVIEDVNRGGIGLSATPFQWIGIHYEFYVEKYKHRFNNSTLADVARIANVPVNDPTQPSFEDPGRTDFWPLDQVTLGFVPSTTKLVNNIRFEKKIGPAMLNFGYSNVFLDQDKFTAFARDRGLDRGRIITHTGFVNWNMPLARSVDWNVHFQYRQRDNNSTFPALDPQGRTVIRNGVPTTVFDYANPLLDGGLHGAIFGPFIDKIETFKFGTDFTLALPVASSRIVAGWEREDTSRKLIFGDPPLGVRSIDPNEAFVRPDSVNDTFFVNYSARPARNLQLRWNNSVTLGHDLGLITEAETGVKSRVGLGYYMPNLFKGGTIDVFYQVRYAENDAITITSLDATNTLIDSGRQDREQLFQSAGLTFTLMPSERWTGYSGYLWHRDSLEANFMRTDLRRYEAPWQFTAITRSRYLTDAHTGFIGSSYEFTKRWIGTVNYTVTAISGELGTGEIKDVLGRDNDLDNITHHVDAGLDYHIKPNWTVGARYAYAVYHDSINRRLNSGFHTIGVSASLKF